MGPYVRVHAHLLTHDAPNRLWAGICAPGTVASMGALGPTRPDRLTVWPVENDGFGIDVRWSGADGNRRATVVRGLLEQAGVKARLTQHVDGRGWELRVGPVPGADVARMIDEFVW